MFRAYAKLIVILIVLLSAITTASLALGDVFPSKFIFTVMRTTCMAGCGEQRPENVDIVMIDSDRRVELPIFRSIIRSWLPNVFNQEHVILLRNDNARVVPIVNLEVYTMQGETDSVTFASSNHDIRPFDSLWSADGDMFYMAGNEFLFRYDFNTQSLDKVFSGDASIAQFFFSSDERFVIVQLENGDIYRQNLDDVDDIVLLIQDTIGEMALTAEFSSNGYLAVVQQSRLVILDAINDQIVDIISDLPPIFSFQWSPDGEWLTIFTYNELGTPITYTNPEDIYNFHLETRLLYRLQNENVSGLTRVMWSSDSEYFALIVISTNGRTTATYVCDSNGDNVRLLTELGESLYSAHWMPDHPILLFSQVHFSKSSQAELFMVDVSLPTLNPILVDQQGIAWNIDFQGNDVIYYRRYYDYFLSYSRLYAFNVETGATRALSSEGYNILEYFRWQNN